MESIWQETGMPKFPHLQRDLHCDVLIVGGGLAGILCAWALQRAGVCYALLEADRIGSHTSGHTTAKITAQHGLVYGSLLRRFGEEKAKLYLQANLQALEMYKQICKEIACDFSEQDSFVYSTDDLHAVEEELEALHRLGYPAELAGSLPLPFVTAGAVKFPKQAQFHPLKFLSSIAKNLHIYENTPVTELTKNGAKTPFGQVFAKKTIITTHFPICNKHGLYFAKQYQHRSYVLALRSAPTFPGMYVDAAQTGLSFRHHGDLLLLGGGGHRTGKQGGAWDYLAREARRFYPKSEVVAKWAEQDCMTLDSVPYIGQYSTHTPTLFVATGFQKWGMTTAMVAAHLLKDLVQEKQNPYAEVFSPSRSMLRPQLAVNLAESTMGLLSLRTPRCPHLGCALKWNKHEHSWDCSCHGSRFSSDGRLLDGPANGDLK